MQTPQDPDDPNWNEWLAAADPISECGAEFAAALERLQNRAMELQQNQVASESRVNGPAQTATKRWNAAIAWWTTAALVMLSLGATSWLVWLKLRPDNAANLVETKEESSNTGSADQTSPNGSNINAEPQPNSLAHSPDSVPRERDKRKTPAERRDREKIRSVEELLKLTPSQLAKVQRRLDQTALDEELLDWLREWQVASPEQRSLLEQQWVARRGFWSGWTLQGLRQWQDPMALQAGIEILSLELGPAAPEQLAFCLQRVETAGLAVPFLLPRANEVQLANWLTEAPDASTAQALISELAGRSGQVATEALAELAADHVCHQVLRNAVLKWHPAHAQRALAQLNSANSQQQFFAAMMLAVIEQDGLDQELLTKARSGVQALPALSAYVFRHQDQLAEKLKPLQQSPSAMAAIPSAQQRSQKWQRQQRLESPGPQSLRKVCQLCVSAS
jgi:hypothetical protein